MIAKNDPEGYDCNGDSTALFCKNGTFIKRIPYLQTHCDFCDFGDCVPFYLTSFEGGEWKSVEFNGGMHFARSNPRTIGFYSGWLAQNWGRDDDQGTYYNTYILYCSTVL